MSNIQIVTDSTAYFTKKEIKDHNIKVVPLSVHFQGKDSKEGLPGEFEEFFSKLKESKDFPSTSQPPAGAFAEVYKNALQEGKEVIAILISSKLSGTYNSAVLGADMVESDKITIIDSDTTASNLKHIVIRAQEMALEGKSRQEIEDYVEDQKTRMGILLTVDTLDYLKKGGRLSNTQAFMGSILNIKPILELKEGVIVPVGKARGKKKAIEIMINKIPREATTIYIPHILNEKEAEEVKVILKEEFPKAQVELEVLGPVIGAHLGPKAMGLCYTW